MEPIGYWRGPQQPGLPDPVALIDERWDTSERNRVAAALGAGATHQPGEGCSICRICGAPNGFLDLSDGTYVWPEGLAHYVAEHAVRLPPDVVGHLLSGPTVAVVVEPPKAIEP